MIKTVACVLLLLTVTLSSPCVASEAQFNRAAAQVVKLLVEGRADLLYSEHLAKPRRKDTPKAVFTKLIRDINQDVGHVTLTRRLTKMDQEPIGGYRGIPTVDKMKAEDRTFARRYYDTIWQLESGPHKNFMLVTMVMEGKQPRVLWLQIVGESIKTAEFRKVEKAMREQAETFLELLLANKRQDIINQWLSQTFAKRLPNDHLMSMLEQLRHRIGVRGGVTYYSGWVQQDPAGVTVVFKQSQGAEKGRYSVYVRLVEEDGKFKVDAVADSPDLEAKPTKGPKKPPRSL